MLADPYYQRGNASGPTVSSALSARIASALATIPSAAKRQARRNSPESWAPYYAGYSTEFADAVIRAACLPVNSTVYDPWNGSGTTTLAASTLGHRSYGIDLNPAAVLLAKARLVDHRDARGVQGLIRRIAKGKNAGDRSLLATGDPLCDWLPAPVVGLFRNLERKIVEQLASPQRGLAFDVTASDFPPLAAFVLLSLISAARTLTNVKTTSNPARFTPGRKPNVRRGHLETVWPEFAERMSQEFPVLEACSQSSFVELGDARTYSPREKADFVLTSPPYLTRLDYPQATAFALAALGLGPGSPKYDALRRSLMGAPLVRRGEQCDSDKALPTTILSLLKRIKGHPSKASDSYYYKTYRQYFHDAHRALRTLHATMKRGSAAALVVQSSYYKDIRVDLPRLYVDLARAGMFSASIVFEFPVKRVISTIHPGTRNYRAHLDYRESVILLERN